MHPLKILAKFPLVFLYFLSSICAFVLFHIVRYRRSTSYSNLKNSFPEKTKQEVYKIQKSSYLYMTDCFFEAIKALDMKEQELNKRVTFNNLAQLSMHLENNESALLLSAHTASPEWVILAATSELNSFIDSVYKPAHSKFIDRFIFDVRSRFGGTPIPYKKLAKDVVLRKNVTRGIAILADLSPRHREQTININFLNQPTRFFQSIERIFRLAAMPVYFAAIKRTKRGYYQVSLYNLCESSEQLAEDELTKKYAQLVEQTILETPHAWLWTHRRWKHPTT